MQFERKKSVYEKYIKRVLDIICSLLAIIVFCWLYLIIAILVRIKLGKPVLFKQPRPGLIDPKTGKERIFDMYKFRTMTDEKDPSGKLLPDEVRLTQFGKKLRATSLDELPEAFNILKGDMSVVGPRPQLVRDMVFMSDEQRMRHTAKPGLTGLAQVNGRNAITWNDKLRIDLDYIKDISFVNDMKLVLLTAKRVLGRGESSQELDITLDYGDELLNTGAISRSEYSSNQDKAQKIICTHMKGPH